MERFSDKNLAVNGGWPHKAGSYLFEIFVMRSNFTFQAGIYIRLALMILEMIQAQIVHETNFS